MTKNKIKNFGKIASLAVLSLMTIVSGFAMPVQKAEAALVPGGAVGPVIPAGIGKGFPAWYMDQNGLALEVMEAADGFGISDPVDPANPFSQELGFNAEGFYWVTEGAPANPHGVSLMVLALEMAFAGEAAVDGEQSVFGRIRFRFDVGEPGTYTIRHPFGTNTYVVDTVGFGPEINDSSDIGCFATLGVLSCNPNNPPGNLNNFGLALQSGIGPFLTWDTFNLDPALTDLALVNAAFPGKRYVGNPGIAHAITGSPVGQNFIRVEGPNIGGVGINSIEETLFSVAGRIAVIDTVAPVIGAVTPASVAVGSTNVRIDANITDNLGIKPLASGVKIDLGALSDTVALTANLTGAQEVPGPGGPATGSGTFTLDKIAKTLTFNISFSGLSAAETAAHIHGPAVAGAAALPIFTLPAGNPKVGVWNYGADPTVLDVAALEADISAGRTYVNIHSALFGNGETRGQILSSAANVQNMILTSGTATNGVWSVIVPSVSRLGAFTLPITATDGSNTATANPVLSVVPLLTAVNVTPVASTIIVGNTQQLTVAALDPAGAPIVPTPPTTWASSNPLAAAVNGNGLVTAIAVGTSTITATVNDGVTTLSGTASVTVNPIPVLTTITVAPTTATAIIGGPAVQFTATALDQLGAPIVPAPVFAWTSSNPAVATIDANGLATAVTAGTVTITAQSGLISGTATLLVTTEPQVLTSIGVIPATATLTGGTQQLAASGLDQFGGAMVPQPAITFTSSNPAVATVNATGLVTVVSAGTATITATSGVLSGSASITVNAVLTTINVTPSPVSVLVGGTQQLTASALNQFGAVITPTPAITWTSSNNLIATVDTAGLVSGVAIGTPVITAASGLVSGTANLNVALETVAPVITISGANPVIILVGAVYTDAGATATDNVDGNITANIITTGLPISTAATGTFSVVYTVSDAAGNIATATRTVNVVTDIVAPVITITGANPAEVTVGAAYADAGATATDDIDGNITANITSTSTVNAAVAGTYAVVYTVSDASGNVASSTRTVNVTVPAPVASPVPEIIASGGGGGGGGGGGFFIPTPATPAVPATPALPGIAAAIPAIPALPAGQVLGVATFRFTADIKIGDRNDDVRELQVRLRDEGVFTGPVTGFFGPLTQEAVKELQRKNNIPNTGFVGPLTRGSLNSGRGSVSSGPGGGQVAGVSITSAEQRAQIIVQLQAQLLDLLQQLLKALQARAAGASGN